MNAKTCIEFRKLTWAAAMGLLLLASLASPAAAQQRKFYDDDPIAREPNTRDASGARDRDIDLMYDLIRNMFAVPRNPVPVRAQNINSIDEVPDSEWFTNRILAKPVDIDEAVRGPNTGQGPAPGKLVVIRAKQSGVTPGFTIKDSAGQTWFVQFDAPDQSEAASGAAVVATKLFHTLGYFQTENYISYLNEVYTKETSNADPLPPVTLLGFSQGAATAARWLPASAPTWIS